MKVHINSKTIDQKIELLHEKGKAVIDLLKVDLKKLDDQSVNMVYDLFETYQSINNNLSKLGGQLEHAAQIAPVLFEEGLDNIKIDLNTRKDSINIFKKTIITNLNNFAQNIKNQAKRSHDIFFNEIESIGIVQLLGSFLEFRKEIDKEFPSMSNIIINAAANALVSMIGIYSPTLSQILTSFKIVEKVSSFLKIENLGKTIDTLENISTEIKKDKELNEICKLGEIIGELSIAVSSPVSTLIMVGFAVKTIEKIIAHVNVDAHAKEFVKHLGEVAKQLPSTKAEVKENLSNLGNSLKKLADSSLNTDEVKKFNNLMENNIKEMEKIYNKNFEKGKNIFEKVIHAQEAAKLLNSSIDKFKHEISKNHPNKSVIEKFVKESAELVNKKITSVGAELLQKAKKSPIVAKELGLNLKVELKLGKGTSKSASR